MQATTNLATAKFVHVLSANATNLLSRNAESRWLCVKWKFIDFRRAELKVLRKYPCDSCTLFHCCNFHHQFTRRYIDSICWNCCPLAWQRNAGKGLKSTHTWKMDLPLKSKLKSMMQCVYDFTSHLHFQINGESAVNCDAVTRPDIRRTRIMISRLFNSRSSTSAEKETNNETSHSELKHKTPRNNRTPRHRQCCALFAAQFLGARI